MLQSRRSFLLATLAAGLAPRPTLRGQALPHEPAAADSLTPAARQAIAAGLDYLAHNQATDGSFGTGAVYRGNIAITSLAGLALLGAGHRPGSGRLGKCLARVLDYVLDQKDPVRPGYLHSARDRSHGPMYSHGFGTLLLGEALGAVGERSLYERIRSALAAGVKVILQAQNDHGGWRYQPGARDADISVTVCQVMALRSARNAGIAVPRGAIERCVHYVKSCQDPSTGGFRYGDTPGSSLGFARTAAGLAALFSAGVYRGPEIERGLAYLLREREDGAKRALTDTYFYYGHYYAAQATWTAGGRFWSEYFPGIRDELIAPTRLRTDGSWTDQICTHYATAMACIILQVPRNYLPILQK